MRRHARNTDRGMTTKYKLSSSDCDLPARRATQEVDAVTRGRGGILGAFLSIGEVGTTCLVL